MDYTQIEESTLLLNGFTHKRYTAGEPIFFNDTKSISFNEDLDVYSLNLQRDNNEQVNVCCKLITYFIDNNNKRIKFPNLTDKKHIGIIDKDPNTNLPIGTILYTNRDLHKFLQEHYKYQL